MLSYLTSVHRRVHNSNYFDADHIFSAVASGASAFFHFKTGDYEAHAIFAATVGGRSILTLYEDADLSGDGTSVSIVCHNRKDVRSPLSSIYHTPTINSNGSQVSQELIAASSRGQTIGGSTRVDREEWVLKPNTSYLLEAVNETTGDIDIQAKVSFYERAH
jgi:hypothetical protein